MLSVPATLCGTHTTHAPSVQYQGARVFRCPELRRQLELPFSILEACLERERWFLSFSPALCLPCLPSYHPQVLDLPGLDEARKGRDWEGQAAGPLPWWDSGADCQAGPFPVLPQPPQQ